ncbi:ATP synthase subunit I [Clostridium magnum]|uniref:ATP synthase I chain n=1 Tax=Clostridium magnum DSM 2767 TaxID=1121326 RepID=A0A161WEJ4_9CLOT|nr:ATP synthase subunit I [Clostridium magnum]KZL90085.1 hypothetical protein CLMAG_45710 [Clostridium magnum DSM 2767]SHH59953.1 ATP synthase protein I [Clostridium magnum DSM 2767]
MKYDLRDVFGKVIIFDIMIGVICAGFFQLIFKKYSLIFLGGLVLALINFLVNGIITEYMLLKNKNKYVLSTSIGLIVRVAVVCGIAIFVYRIDQFNVVAYMLGYSCHFISLTLYGIKINNEGK